MPRVLANARLSVVLSALAITGFAATLAPLIVKTDNRAHAYVVETKWNAPSDSPASGDTHDVSQAHGETAEKLLAAADHTADPASYRVAGPAPDGRPRVAIIVRGLGISASLTASATARLAPEISLAVSPYGQDLQKLVDMARAAGHEVFLDLPVQLDSASANDSGPKAISSDLTADDVKARLEWALKRATGFPGIVIAPASAVTASKTVMQMLAESPAAKGIVWALPSLAGQGLSDALLVPVEVTLDNATDAKSIDAGLEKLEAAALQHGTALGIAGPAPITIERLAQWTADLDARGIQLVPASALSVNPGS